MSNAMSEPARARAVVAALATGIAVFALIVHRHYPIGDWLFWEYAAMWVLCAWWAVSCLAAGHLLLSRLLRIRLPLREHLVMAFAAGVLIFGTGVFAAGILAWLTPAFFALWPMLLLALGGRPLYRDLRRIAARARLFSRLRDGPKLSWPRGLATIFGLAGVALLYLQILTPANVAYDARWYHLGVAEHYLVEARIAPFTEGWFQGTLPQLATWLYTWAFLAPAETRFFEIELAAHLEFTLFLATLAGIPVLVRWLTRRRGHGGSWAAVFLFPGILLYDSNLNLSADHVLAFWAVPIALAVARLGHGKGMKGGVLLGVMLAGATLTKYQAVYLLAAAGCLMALDLRSWLRRPVPAAPKPFARRLRGRLLALAAGALAMLALTSPHWLKNWIWYENPLYPFMQGTFGGEPWADGVQVRIADPAWQPSGTLAQRVAESLEAVLTFSFVPNDWPKFHGEVPVFGSLFTLMLLPLLWLRRTDRIWGLAAGTLAGVFVWYWTYHQDRYLQSLVPYMAAVTAAALILLWRTRRPLIRLATGLLIALQIVWGGDVPFFPTHAMLDGTPYGPTLKIFSTGYRRAFEERHDAFSRLTALQAVLPEDGKYLLHERHQRLGLRRRLVVDGWGRQGAIVYKTLGGPRAVDDRLRSLGVTGVVWTDAPRGFQRMTDDLVFFDYVLRHTDHRHQVGRFHVSALREAPPPAENGLPRVAIFGCRRILDLGWEEVDGGWPRQVGLGGCREPPAAAQRLAAAAAASRYVIMDKSLRALKASLEAEGWVELFENGPVVALGGPFRRSP